VYGKPAILILDEATSALDSHTEYRVRHALAPIVAASTCFVIAHRLDTIRDADQIAILDGGCFVERGTYDELMARDGFFASLSRRQQDA